MVADHPAPTVFAFPSRAPAVRSPRARRGPAALWAVAAAAVLLQAGLAIVDLGDATRELIAIRVLYNGLIVASALAVFARALVRPAQRLGWALLASGLAAWAAGDLYYALGLQASGASSPSVPDVLYLGFYAATLLGVASLRRVDRRAPSYSVDLLVLLSAAATAWSLIVFGPVSESLHEVSAAAAMTLAYPVLDMVIVLVALSIFVRADWRPGQAWGLIALGFFVCAVADLIYNVQVVGESYSPGTLLDCLWPIATLMIAGAAWSPQRKISPSMAPGRASFSLSLGVTLLALAILVVDHVQRIDLLTFALAATTIVLGVARGGLAYRMRVSAEQEAREAATGTVRALAAAVDAKDAYTHWHSERVALYGSAIAARLGMDAAAVDRLTTAGHLHDVGKIAVPDGALLKPGRLTEEEYEQVKRHSAEGERIVAATGLLDVSVWIRHHHERWDGTGYPDRLAGGQIPLESRILAAADALDAMTTTRTYSAAKTLEEAVVQIAANAGSQFDPSIAACLIELLTTGALPANGQAHLPARTASDATSDGSQAAEYRCVAA